MAPTATMAALRRLATGQRIPHPDIGISVRCHSNAAMAMTLTLVPDQRDAPIRDEGLDF